jgi:hypothetical protein
MCELTKQGLVAAAVCSMPFEKLGRTQAKVLGVPDLPLLMIPHPLGGITLDVVGTRADVAAGQLVKLIREKFA